MSEYLNSPHTPFVLIVMDGFGISLEHRGNAILEASTPNLDAIERRFPFTTLQASGVAVGLPWGEAGNSEVGHLTMGAGRIIYQHLTRVISAIHDGSFYENPAFLNVINHVKKNDSSLHFLGLVSSGSVHSYINHLHALMELAKRSRLEKVFLHVITDGKDAPRDEGASFIKKLEDTIREQYPSVVIASLIGRYWAMDRDEQWERIQRAYGLLVNGIGVPFSDASAFLTESYAKGTADESIEPAYFAREGKVIGRIAPGDGLIIFNFREDSVREITGAFAKDGFSGFPRGKIQNLSIATLTEYDKNLTGVAAAFPPLEIHWPLARVLSQVGKSQLHIAETEKYAHVTYFFNGGIEKPFPEEDRILVTSQSVPHFDEKPEMKTPEITDRIIEHLEGYDFILANFANADMVGHTGNFQAVVKAVEAIDKAIGRLREAVFAKEGILIITGDHGNAEQKIHPFSGEPITEHTSNPVPLYLVQKSLERSSDRSPDTIRKKHETTGGILTDVAPTILELMHIPKPEEMTGTSLLTYLMSEPEE